MTARLNHDSYLVRPMDTGDLTDKIALPDVVKDLAHGDNLELIRKRNTLCLAEVVLASLKQPVWKKHQVNIEQHEFRQQAGHYPPECEPGEKIMYERAGGTLAHPELLIALGVDPEVEHVIIRQDHIHFAVAGDVVQVVGGLRTR